jgi:hypothetical protein
MDVVKSVETLEQLKQVDFGEFDREVDRTPVLSTANPQFRAAHTVSTTMSRSAIVARPSAIVCRPPRTPKNRT